MDIEVLDGAVDLDGAIDTILAIEASGWKGRAGTAVAFKPADEAFYRALARWAAAKGWLRLSFLRLDGQAIAFHYSLQARGVIYALKIGYSEQFAAQAPGKILLVAEIERAFPRAVGASTSRAASPTTRHSGRRARGSCWSCPRSLRPPWGGPAGWEGICERGRSRWRSGRAGACDRSGREVRRRSRSRQASARTPPELARSVLDAT